MGDIARDRTVRPAIIGRGGRRQRGQFSLIAVGTSDRQLHDLAMAGCTRNLDVTLRAVDFPQQIGAP